MEKHNLYSALREMEDAKACLTHAEDCMASAKKRIDENKQAYDDNRIIVASALACGEDREMLAKLDEYSAKMTEIHRTIASESMFRRYRGLEHYLGAAKTNDFKELSDQIEINQGNENQTRIDSGNSFESVMQAGSAIRFFNQVFIQNYLPVRAFKFVMPGIWAGYGMTMNSELLKGADTYPILLFNGITIAMITGIFLASDLAYYKRNPHLEIKKDLDWASEYMKKLLTQYK